MQFNSRITSKYLQGIKMASSNFKNDSYHQFKDAISCLVSHHLHNFSVENKAHAAAKVLFNESIFENKAVNFVVDKISRCYNSMKYNSVALLRAIDANAGLNDTAIDIYASIGNPKRGQANLVKRWELTAPRQVANRYINDLFDVQYDHSTEFGETIRVDYEKVLRFYIKANGLQEKRSGRELNWLLPETVLP
jgi:hypothetical protein